MYSVDSSLESIHSQIEKLKRNAEKLEECLKNNPRSHSKLDLIFNRVQTANSSLKETRKVITAQPQSSIHSLLNYEETGESAAIEKVNKRKREEFERESSKMSIRNLLNSEVEQDNENDRVLKSVQQEGSSAIQQQAKKSRGLSLLSEGNDRNYYEIEREEEEISAKGKEKEHLVSQEEPETVVRSSVTTQAAITHPTKWELINKTEIRGKADKIVFLEENKYALLIEFSAKRSVIEERFIDNSRIGKSFFGDYKITDMSFNPTSMQLFYKDHGAIHIYPRSPGSISDQNASPKEIDHTTNAALLSDVTQLKSTDQSLAFGLHDGQVLLYDISSLAQKGQYASAHSTIVTALCLNDKYLVSGSSDKKVTYVNYINHPTKLIKGISFERTVSAMALEGSTLYAGDITGLLKIVNLDNKTVLSNTRFDGAIVGLIITESGFYVASTTTEKTSNLRYLSHDLREIYSFPKFDAPISSIVKQGDCLLVCTVKGKLDSRNSTQIATSSLYQFKINY